MSSSFRRSLAVVILGLTLAAPCAWAAETRNQPESGTVRPADSAAQATWEFFSRIWSLLADTWRKNGCSLDPFGFCTTSPGGSTPITSADNGCDVDPNGRCLSGH